VAPVTVELNHTDSPTFIEAEGGYMATETKLALQAKWTVPASVDEQTMTAMKKGAENDFVIAPATNQGYG